MADKDALELLMDVRGFLNTTNPRERAMVKRIDDLLRAEEAKKAEGHDGMHEKQNVDTGHAHSAPVEERDAAQSAIPAMLPQLLRDIQSNAAIGEPSWDDIERRIGEVQVALSSSSNAKEGKNAT